MKRSPLFFFSLAMLICVLPSCLGPKMVNKWVAHHYTESPSEAPRKKSEQISFVSKLPGTDADLSKTEKRVSHLLPLLFYWEFDYRNLCTLNPQIPVNNFMTTVQSYAGKGLKQKLNGGRLELTIEQLPHAFTVDDYGHAIWVIYLFGWEKLSVQPEKSEMVITYKVFNGNNEVQKNGSITVQDLDYTFNLKMFNSLKKLTWAYLAKYDANITTMSRQVVDQLVSEL